MVEAKGIGQTERYDLRRERNWRQERTHGGKGRVFEDVELEE